MVVLVSWVMLLAALATIGAAMRPSRAELAALVAQAVGGNTEQRGVSVGPVAGLVSALLSLMGGSEVLAPIVALTFITALLAAPVMFLRGIVNVAGKKPAARLFWSAFASVIWAAVDFVLIMLTGAGG